MPPIVMIAVFWILFIGCILSKGPGILYLFFGSVAFASFSLVPTEMIGGVTLLPLPFAALGLFVWVLKRKGAFTEMVQLATAPQHLLFLTLFVAIAVASAVFLPRLFDGKIYVVPVRTDGYGVDLLHPTSQNITQSLYLIISLVCVLAMAMVSRINPRWVFDAALFGGLVIVLSGVADILTRDTAHLDFLRTASYAMNTEQAFGDTKRIVGLTPEPASFGTICTSMAALIHFLSHGFHLKRLTAFYSGSVVLGLIVMAVLSTSTTAYLTLALLGGFIIWTASKRMLLTRRRLNRSTALRVVTLISATVAASILVAIFKPGLIAPTLDLAYELIFEKTTTDSFKGRSFWNRTSWEAFLSTGGLGVGLGATRASSWVIAVISNVGFIGGFFLCIFMAQIFTRKARRGSIELRARVEAAQMTSLITLAGLVISGTQVDFGLIVAASWGMALSWSEPPKIGARSSPRTPTARLHSAAVSVLAGRPGTQSVTAAERSNTRT